jgi:hypothetical protein
MADEKLFEGLTLEGINVDEEGRVIVTDPKLAERLRSAVQAAQPRWGANNSNCHGCHPHGSNYAAGCGVPVTK